MKKLYFIIPMIGLFSACVFQHEEVKENSPEEMNDTFADSTATLNEKIDVHLSYAVKDNPMAAELRDILSFYCTDLSKSERPFDLYSEETLDFSRFPESSLYSLQHEIGKDKFWKNYQPMILSIYTENSDTLVKVNFARVDTNGISMPIATTNFGVTKKQGRLKLQSMEYLKSLEYEKKEVGNITYFYPPTHDFSIDTANRMQAFNEKLATMFNREPLDCKYFICENNIELNKVLGFDYKYDMYNMNSGSSGLSDIINGIIYAGNGSEYYPHELVHQYTYLAFPKHHKWFDEGFATYIGGSRGMPLDWHLSELHKYLADNDYPDLSDPFKLPYQVSNDTATMYAMGGLIMKMLMKNAVWIV